MIKNYIKIALRNLAKHKAFAFINLFGLSIGLTVGVLILLFITDELSFDQFHEKKDRIYKVVTRNVEGGTMETNAWPVAAKLREEYSAVQQVNYSRFSSRMVNYEGQRYEHEVFYTEPSFFELFSFPFIEGNPSAALQRPNTVVITEELKKRYFGDALALGKTLTMSDSLEFEITGVVANVPDQSHIQFDVLISFSTYVNNTGFSYSEGWGNFNVRNYILLDQNASIEELEASAKSMYMETEGIGERFKELGMQLDLEFIPLSDIYLYSDTANGFGPKGSIDQVYLVASIAIFVILLACINFVNLATARSVYRAKEVGLRKIVGSTRTRLIVQFMTEALFMTILAFLVVALLLDFTLPFFNSLMDKSYELSSLLTSEIIWGIVSLIVLITFMSGFYPAWVLSSFKPVAVLKGNLLTKGKGGGLRKALVIFQFFISSTLVLGTLVVLNQLSYMQNQDLGFDKEQILVLDATRVSDKSSQEAFRNELERISSVDAVSFTNALPGRPGWQGQWAYPEKITEENQVDTEYMSVDEHYIETLGLEITAGENFSKAKQSNLADGLIINETTAKEMGWFSPEEAIGKEIVSPSGYPAGKVIGVVKDFHGLGLQEEIWPQVMDYTSDQFGRYYAIRYTTGGTTDLVDRSKALWQEYLGDYTFEYFFLNEDFDRQYRAEERLMTVLIVFALLTVLIAVIGLLGLVSFMVLSRTKEIGIRKVLGAGTFGLAGMLSKDFALLVLVANILAVPLVWYGAEKWLQGFAFRMDFNPVIFPVAIVITLFIAIAAVSVQTVKAALTNPVDTLRSE